MAEEEKKKQVDELRGDIGAIQWVLTPFSENSNNHP